MATPVSVEAEFYYRVIAKELEREQPAGDIKSHIYIFERPADWAQFQSSGALEPWTGGIHSEGSLFILRNPAHRFADNTLGHEISHLVLHRFYTAGIPCWLDEGFAQYVSKGAHASYQRARGYIARPQSRAIALEELMPLNKLMAMTRPPNESVALFYNESERLVRFLAATINRHFLACSIRSRDISRSRQHFLAVTRETSPASSILEEKFREYAAKDFGTTLQQADAD